MHGGWATGWKARSGAVIAVALASLSNGCIQPAPRSDGDVSDTSGPPDGSSDGSGDGQTEVVDCVGCIIADTCRADGEVNGANPCEVCDPVRSPDGWSPALGDKPCEDSDACTDSGVCKDGGCVALLRPACDDLPECVDSVACEGDTCSYVVRPGECFIDGACRADGDGPADNPCLACDAAASPLAWSLTRAGCDDGDACTYEDVCNDGVCAGQLNTCSDAFECTIDFCDGGQCQHQVVGEKCFVDGECFAQGDTRPGDPCHSCRPNISTSKLSLALGSVCDDGDSCTATSQCNVSGVCEGAPSSADEEPNGGSATAQDVGIASDGFPSGSVEGNIIGDDLDVFRWGMTFSSSGVFRTPRARVLFDDPQARVELCLYARCGQVVGSFVAPVVVCGDDRESGFDDKTQGCCAVFDGDATPEMDLAATCVGVVVQGFAFARVSTVGDPDAATCGGYSLQWGVAD